MRKAKLFLFAGLVAMTSLFFVGTASADCATTPTAATCADELADGLGADTMSIVATNVLGLKGLIALVIGLGVIVGIVFAIGRRAKRVV